MQDLYRKALQVLKQISVRDIPLRFPRLGHRETPSLDTCQSVCSSFDHWDLQGVISSLRHGYSINWDAAKRFWAQHPITDPRAFAVLLSVWPPALQELMKPLTPETGSNSAELAANAEADAQAQVKMSRNIRMLLNVGDTNLAKRCLRLAPDGRSLAEVACVWVHARLV